MNKITFFLIMLLLNSNLFSLEREITTFGRDKIALEPGRMGPNALPVPRMSTGIISKALYLSTAFDISYDPEDDLTLNPFVNIDIPLGNHSSFSIYTTPFEYFTTSDKVQQLRHAEESKGFAPSDLYFKTSIQILNTERNNLNLLFDLRLKTTTGKELWNARHINAPAYFFELTGAKQLKIEKNILTLSTLISFIAWQVNVDEQNDAMGYGGLISLQRGSYISNLSLEGYTGWIKNGDSPLVGRLKLIKDLNKKKIFTEYQLGFRDQPLHRLQLGMELNLNNKY